MSRAEPRLYEHQLLAARNSARFQELWPVLPEEVASIDVLTSDL